MNKIFKNKHSPNLIIVFLSLLLVYLLAVAFDVYELNSEVDRLNNESRAMAYAQLASNVTQRLKSDMPAKMQMRLLDAIHGVAFDPSTNTTDVRILHDGVYFLMAAPQVGSLNDNADEAACSNFFFTVNNVHIANSSVTLCQNDYLAKDVITVQNIVPLHEGDEVSIMMSTSNAEKGVGIEVHNPEDQPVVPSIIFSIFRIGAI